MRIIVESGATKSDWRLAASSGEQLAKAILPGMNAATMSSAEIQACIEKGLEFLEEQYAMLNPDSAEFYVAGAVSEDARGIFADTIQKRFPNCSVDVQSDMIAAARAIFGQNEGIVCIIGTGSNCCLYDGHKLSQSVYSGGFILGDEGSAASLGRRFLSDYLKNKVPAAIADEFRKKYDGTYKGIVEKVYKSDSPSKYLGGLAPFIMDHYSDPYIKALVDGNFCDFFDNFTGAYDVKHYPVGVVGGFGWAHRSIISAIAASKGISIKKYIASPIDELAMQSTIL